MTSSATRKYPKSTFYNQSGTVYDYLVSYICACKELKYRPQQRYSVHTRFTKYGAAASSRWSPAAVSSYATGNGRDQVTKCRRIDQGDEPHASFHDNARRNRRRRRPKRRLRGAQGSRI